MFWAIWAILIVVVALVAFVILFSSIGAKNVADKLEDDTDSSNAKSGKKEDSKRAAG